ncbi:MAG: hypothetical protein ACTHM1_09130 [Solirubrobacteraceae bacterium]
MSFTLQRASWARDPGQVRARFEKNMTSDRLVTTKRIAEFLAPSLDSVVKGYEAEGVDSAAAHRLAVDSCSEILLDAQGRVMDDIESRLPSSLTAGRREQKRMQAAKSNAGKIFERFSAFAISRALAGTEWAVWKDTADVGEVLGVPKKELLGLKREAFGSPIEVLLEADYVIFQPMRPLETLVLVSTKSR